MVGFRLLEWVFIMRFLSGVRFIEVFMDCLLLIVVMDVLLLRWNMICWRLVMLWLRNVVVVLFMYWWFVLWKL